MLKTLHLLFYLFLASINHSTPMINSSSKNVILPFSIIDNQLLVTCSINGIELLLLFDTGASNSFLLPETVKQLKLNQVGEEIVTRSDGIKFKSPIFISSKFKIGTFELGETKILSNELPPKLKCLGIKGFLGANVINNLNWKINFERKTIEVSKNIFNSSITACKIKYIKNNPILPLTIEGETFDFVIDFGYWGDLAMNFETLKKSLFSSRSPKTLIQAQGMQNNNLVIIDKFYDYLLKEVSISNGVKVNNIVLSGWNLPVSFIGMSFLQRFEIIINSSQSSYIFIPRKKYSANENPLLFNFGNKIEFDGANLFASEFYSTLNQNILKAYSKKIINVDQFSAVDIRNKPCLFNNLLHHLSSKNICKVVFENGAVMTFKKELVKFQ